MTIETRKIYICDHFHLPDDAMMDRSDLYGVKTIESGGQLQPVRCAPDDPEAAMHICETCINKYSLLKLLVKNDMRKDKKPNNVLKERAEPDSRLLKAMAKEEPLKLKGR